MIKPLLFLIVAGLLLACGLYFVQGDRPVYSTAVTAGTKLFKGLNTDEVTSVQIKKGSSSFELKKKDKNWVMASHKDRAVKEDRVKALFDTMKDATLKETRTGAETKFQLDPENRAEIFLAGGSTKTTLYLGKGVDYTNSFVRTEANGPILEIDKDIGSQAGLKAEGDKRVLDPANFYDLKIIGASSADDVIDIAIKKGHDVYRIQRFLPGKGPVEPKQTLGADEKPIWWMTEPEGFAANDTTANSMASTLAYLNAKGYADETPEKDRGLDKPSAKVKVRMKDGTEYDLTFGNVAGEDVFMSVSGKPDPYKIYKYVYDNLTKIDELKKKDEEKKEAAPAPESSATPAPAPAPTPAPKKPAPEIPPPPPIKTEGTQPPTLPPAVVKEKPEEKK